MYNVLCATRELGKEIYDITRVLGFFKIPALNRRRAKSDRSETF